MYLLIGDWKKLEFKDRIGKEDLIRLKNRYLDWILDLEAEKYFDVEANEWKYVKEFNLI